jgi:hypothetical protein
VVYEPVAYDKYIEVTGDGRFQPVVRMDADLLRLPSHLFLHTAQAVLELFRPDVWEGDAVGCSMNYHPDRRFMQHAKLC